MVQNKEGINRARAYSYASFDAFVIALVWAVRVNYSLHGASVAKAARS